MKGRLLVSLPRIHATTILCVRRDGHVALGGDGQVTVGETVMKANAHKVRTLKGGKILAGFAGAAADAFTLFEKFEEKLERYPGNLPRAAVELAKDWRTDRVLRRLEALLVVADREHGLRHLRARASHRAGRRRPRHRLRAAATRWPPRARCSARRALPAAEIVRKSPRNRGGHLHLHEHQHHGAGAVAMAEPTRDTPTELPPCRQPAARRTNRRRGSTS